MLPDRRWLLRERAPVRDEGRDVEGGAGWASTGGKGLVAKIASSSCSASDGGGDAEWPGSDSDSEMDERRRECVAYGCGDDAGDLEGAGRLADGARGSVCADEARTGLGHRIAGCIGAVGRASGKGGRRCV